MRSRTLIVVCGMVAAIVVLPGAAEAKGIQRATVTGPRLESPITFTLDNGVDPFVNETGIYPSLFETQPNPVVQSQPVDALGPRYDIEYVMKMPHHKAIIAHQDLFPYAQPDPVLYTAPGQRTIDNSESVGGWYTSSQSLLMLLIERGLPRGPANEAAAQAGSSDETPAAAAPITRHTPDRPDRSWPWLPVSVGAALLAIATALAIRATAQRRRVRAGAAAAG